MPHVEPRFDEQDAADFLFLLNVNMAKRRRELQKARPGIRVDYIARVQQLIAKGVEDWLNSGLRADGSECPAERKAQPSSHLYAALYSLSGRVTIHFVNDRPLAQLDWAGGEDNELPELEAATVLTMLLLSDDLRLRIAKCRKCGMFFFLGRKRKEVYANGIFCSPAHQRAITAARSVRARRDGRREQQLERAAAELRRLRRERTDWYEDVSLKQKLVNAVNRRLPFHESRITAKWVTQNRKQIQAKANSGKPESSGRINHATR